MGLSDSGCGLLLAAAAAGSLLGSFLAEGVERKLGRARSLVLTILGGALLVGTPALTANPFVIGAAFVVGGTTSSSATSSRCPCGSGSPPPGCWGA